MGKGVGNCMVEIALAGKELKSVGRSAFNPSVATLLQAARSILLFYIYFIYLFLC